MPVDSYHPDYAAALPKWVRARDVVAGEDALKAKGEAYLPRLDSQTDGEYARYVQRAAFYNAAARSREGFAGLIFRRDPVVSLGTDGSALSAALGRIKMDADMGGGSLESIGKWLVNEVLSVGRAGTLVEWSEVEGRAFICNYPAERIINWRCKRWGGRTVLSVVVLMEDGDSADNADEFLDEAEPQLRVLKLVGDETGAPVYTVEVWKKTGEEKERKWERISVRVPTRRGLPLRALPFVFHSPVDSSPDVKKAPLEDLITVNLDHFRLDADYKHGMHFTALPTAWVSGFGAETELKIGSTAAWVTETVGASAGFLEFKGQGLQTFERAMEHDEKLMAQLGSRLLQTEKRVAEAAQTVALKQSQESSVIGNLAGALSRSMTECLRWAGWWGGTAATLDDSGLAEVSFAFSRDFDTARMSGPDLLALVQTWQAGLISSESALDLMREGELLPTGRTNQQELELILRERTTGMAPEPKEKRLFS